MLAQSSCYMLHREAVGHVREQYVGMVERAGVQGMRGGTWKRALWGYGGDRRGTGYEGRGGVGVRCRAVARQWVG